MDRAAIRLGVSAASIARTLLLAPHRKVQIPQPPPIDVGGASFDVIDDLVAYTALPKESVNELLRRQHESFRSEWHSVPSEVRADHWYYLSSRMYLFANAVHLHSEEAKLRSVLDAAPRTGRVLEFGGGTGNLSLALAAAGLQASYLELSALQKDFVRFRIARHGLEDSITVLDWWEPLESSAFDVVVGLDVFEHLPDLEATLEDQILPSVAAGGLVIEASPFGQTVDNPMHHEQAQVLDATFAKRHFHLEQQVADVRFWRLGDADVIGT